MLPEVLRNAVPKGFVGTAPYVVKTLDGEYLVAADGTAQFFPLGRSPLAPIDVNGRTRMSGPGLGQLISCRVPTPGGECFRRDMPVGLPGPGGTRTTPGPEICVTAIAFDTNYAGSGKCGATWNNPTLPPGAPD